MDRTAPLIPAPAIPALLAYTKAELAELVWDLAVRVVGEEAGDQRVVDQIVDTHELLQYGRARPLGGGR